MELEHVGLVRGEGVGPAQARGDHLLVPDVAGLPIAAGGVLLEAQARAQAEAVREGPCVLEVQGRAVAVHPDGIATAHIEHIGGQQARRIAFVPVVLDAARGQLGVLVGSLGLLEAGLEGMGVVGQEEAGPEVVEGDHPLDAGPIVVPEPRVVAEVVEGGGAQGGLAVQAGLLAVVGPFLVVAGIARDLGRQHQARSQGLGPDEVEEPVRGDLLVRGDGHDGIVDPLVRLGQAVVLEEHLQRGVGRGLPGDLAQEVLVAALVGGQGADGRGLGLAGPGRHEEPELVLEDRAADVQARIVALGGQDGAVQAGIGIGALGFPLGILVVDVEGAFELVAAPLHQSIAVGAVEVAVFRRGPDAAHLHFAEPVGVGEQPLGIAGDVADVHAVHEPAVLGGVAAPGVTRVHARRQAHDGGHGPVHREVGQIVHAVVLGESDGGGVQGRGLPHHFHRGRAGSREPPVDGGGAAQFQGFAAREGRMPLGLHHDPVLPGRQAGDAVDAVGGRDRGPFPSDEGG